MKNNLKPNFALITYKKQESFEAVCFRLKLEESLQSNFEFVPGQFVMVGVPGFGEAPFTISSAPQKSEQYLEICVRQVGELTRRINQQKKGEYLTVRGPYGHGFEAESENFILIAGGCGFIPLKSVLLDALSKKKNIQTFFGCKSKDTLLFKDQYKKWQPKMQFEIITEKDKVLGFSDKTGFVTDLINKADLLPDAKVFIVGPDVMFKPVVQSLLKKNVKAEDIYLSLERRMYCGYGVCQHCAIGEKYVCKDGPVFTYSELKNISTGEINL